ncbi:hypothetical protein SKA53_05573 [Yoonia vestfoldensis SKA53]|uniref:Uncharacterized protein n=2 Tax=Paracoccaceae TaxID=31989 RepID=A3V6K8_9RHOB|nr:hypothetical protein SKA53_05573 [Yoonia vestfoldensis SKA53]
MSAARGGGKGARLSDRQALVFGVENAQIECIKQTVEATMSRYLLIPAALLLALPALAQSTAIDVNGDGQYSFPEVQAAAPEVSEDNFAALDINGDGLLDAAEIAAGEAAGILPR